MTIQMQPDFGGSSNYDTTHLSGLFYELSSLYYS